jgi:hypothetical protein
MGLLAPLPTSAFELNRNAIQRDVLASQGAEQITSISQFSDLRPTDWAYQALSNLVKRYGCVAGYPNGSFRGGQSMTRFEAAALLNACLDRVTEVTDELRRLMAEFDQELALLKGRVDGLEAQVGELESGQFSTTTKLSGLATFVVGGVSNNPAGSQVTFNDDLQLNLDTSFTGKDLLRTVLRAGNFDGDRNAFGGGISTLEIAFQEETGPDVVGIDKLYYQFPLGPSAIASQFTATLGGRVGQEDMLALWPSAYPSDTILNVLTLNGAPLAYNKNLGPGLGLWWQHNGWSVSANYVAANGFDSSDGLFTNDSAGTSTVQLGYGQENWGIAAIYSYLDGGVEIPGATPFVSEQEGSTNAFGISGFWQPAEGGWIPSISAGYGLNRTSGSDLRTSQSWMVGLQWSDVLAEGNSFGMGVGQPALATATRNGVSTEAGVWAWEWWYKWQVSDAISVTPGVFYLNNPGGNEGGKNQFGALIKTSFQF